MKSTRINDLEIMYYLVCIVRVAMRKLCDSTGGGRWIPEPTYQLTKLWPA